MSVTCPSCDREVFPNSTNDCLVNPKQPLDGKKYGTRRMGCKYIRGWGDPSTYLWSIKRWSPINNKMFPQSDQEHWNVGTEHSNNIRTLKQIIGTTLELWEISLEHGKNVGTFTRMLDCRWTQCYWTSLVTFEQHSKPLQSVEIKSVKNSLYAHPRHGSLQLPRSGLITLVKKTKEERAFLCQSKSPISLWAQDAENTCFWLKIYFKNTYFKNVAHWVLTWEKTFSFSD